MNPITTSSAVQSEQNKALIKSNEKLGIIESEIEGLLAIRAKAWREIGDRLTMVHDEKLYRKEDATFEDWCQRRWKISRQYAYQIMAASKVAENCQELLTFDSVNSALSMVPFSEEDQKAIADDLVKTNQKASNDTVKAASEKQNIKPKLKPKTKAIPDNPPPSKPKKETERQSKIRAIQEKLDGPPMRALFADRLRFDMAKLKAEEKASDTSDAEVVAPPDDDGPPWDESPEATMGDPESIARYVEGWYEANRVALNQIPPPPPGVVISKLCASIRAL